MDFRQDGQNRTSATDREAVARQLAAAAGQAQLSSQELEERRFLTHEAETYIVRHPRPKRSFLPFR